MLYIGICDDDEQFTGVLETAVLEMSKNMGVEIKTNVFLSGESLANDLCKDGNRHDLLFLDIEMKNMDGIEVAKKIREVDGSVLLIYVTSHQEYAIEAYEVSPFRFLVKPLNYDILKKYFLQAYNKLSAGKFYYQFKYSREYYKILVEDILYFESYRRIVMIKNKYGRELKYYDRLNKIEKELKNTGANFWRIHQSYLVNVRYIIKKSYDEIELVDGTILMISEDRRKEISEKYFDLIVEENK